MNRLLLAIIAVWLYTLAALAQTADADGQLYAVLISGGRNRLTNPERYWNDCSLLYRVLRHTYHVPQRNIAVLMSDGGDPAEDMIRADGTGFASSPADLDGDGDIDVYFDATLLTVERVLSGMAQRLTAKDRLFVFVIDHGGIDNQWAEPFVWLWNDERLLASRLGSLLSRFRVKSMSMVLGQCYAGGFLTALQREGRVIVAACGSDEQSWACEDLPYDEFVYHWTCAIAGQDLSGRGVAADADADGRVTMSEAFSYARQHDRRPETPAYVSLPAELGDQWAFGDLNGSGISERGASPPAADAAVYSLSGVRCTTLPDRGRRLYIHRRGGRVTKIVR